jgi:hypothetical protein
VYGCSLSYNIWRSERQLDQLERFGSAAKLAGVTRSGRSVATALSSTGRITSKFLASDRYAGVDDAHHDSEEKDRSMLVAGARCDPPFAAEKTPLWMCGVASPG